MESKEAVLQQEQETKNQAKNNHHVCPWWMGYLLCCPLRTFMENPKKILGPHVEPGMTVIEPGSGMGYFSLPLARMVGPEGRVVCVDIEKRMLSRLEKRARKAGLDDRIETHLCNDGDLGLQAWKGKADLVAAIHVVHEVPDASAFLEQAHDLLKPSSRLLILEPKGHVDVEEFRTTLEHARRVGFEQLETPTLRGELAALLKKRVKLSTEFH